MARGRHAAPTVGRLDGRFYTLWAGQIVSQFGDYVAFLTVPLFVAQLTHRALDFGLVYAAETLPALLFGILGGVLLDRFPLRPLLIFADIGRAVGFVLLAIVAGLDQPEVWMIVILAFVVGTFAASFTAGLRAFLPIIMPSELLPTANARLVLSQQTLFLLGPAAGGFIVALVGFQASYYINAMTFLVSAITMAFLQDVPRRLLEPATGYFAQAKEGFSYLWHETRLRAVTLAGGVVNFTVAFLEAMLVLIGGRLLGLDAPQEFGVFFLFFGLGAVIGALAAPAISRAIGLGPSMVVGLFVFGIGFFALSISDGSATTYLVLVVIGLGPPIANIALTTIRQLFTPDHLLGRVTAASRAVVWGTLPLGALLGGLLADEFQLLTVARVLPIVVIGVGVWLRFTSVWSVRGDRRI